MKEVFMSNQSVSSCLEKLAENQSASANTPNHDNFKAQRDRLMKEVFMSNQSGSSSLERLVENQAGSSKKPHQDNFKSQRDRLMKDVFASNHSASSCLERVAEASETASVSESLGRSERHSTLRGSVSSVGSYDNTTEITHTPDTLSESALQTSGTVASLKDIVCLDDLQQKTAAPATDVARARWEERRARKKAEREANKTKVTYGNHLRQAFSEND